jgi:hypothetical protein
MKKLILTSLALLLMFAPAMAGDFQALNNLSASTMTDDQLAVVVGAQIDQEVDNEIDQEGDIKDNEIDQESKVIQKIYCDDGSCDEGGTVGNVAEVNQSVSLGHAAAIVNDLLNSITNP